MSSLLQEAAACGDVAELSRLLTCVGQHINAKDWDGTTALHASAQAGEAEAAVLLLERGADANVRSNYEDTPLHVAASEGRVATIEVLLSKGASPHARDKFGRTPLDHVRRSREREWESVVALLRAAEGGLGGGVGRRGTQ